MAPVQPEAPGQPVTGQGRTPREGVGRRPVEREPQGGARPVLEELIRLLVVWVQRRCAAALHPRRMERPLASREEFHLQ